MWVSISLHPQQHLLLSVFLNFSYPSSYFTGCVVVFWRRSRPARSAVEGSVFQYTYTRTTEVLWGKRDSKATLSRGECLWSPWPLPQGGSTKSLALTSLYRFFRPLTSKKVLFYYTKVCFGRLSLQTQERVLLNTSKEDICNVKWEMVKRASLIPGGSSPDSVRIKILSKHLLPQFRVREF